MSLLRTGRAGASCLHADALLVVCHDARRLSFGPGVCCQQLCLVRLLALPSTWPVSLDRNFDQGNTLRPQTYGRTGVAAVSADANMTLIDTAGLLRTRGALEVAAEDLATDATLVNTAGMN